MSAAVSAVASPVDGLLRILMGARRAGASDVHLRADRPPSVRMQGELCPLDHPDLSAAFVARARDTLGAWAGQSADKLAKRQGNFSTEVEGVGRFRVHHYMQRGTVALALRSIPSPVPDFAALRVPPSLKRLATLRRGLVLVTGATGNGKSTTIASLLERVNHEYRKHIVTIENPIEFLLEEAQSTISQREIGRDVADVREGLLGALREDPDWIFVGEIRTPEEFEVALSAAEAGHVVVSTLHSQDVARAVSRMIHFFPEGHRDSARQRIADSLASVVAQRLVTARGSRERVLVTEVLVRAPTIQDCIRDSNRFRGLTQALDAGSSEYGTHSFDAQLIKLTRDGVITMDTARAAATSPNDLVRALRMNVR